MENEDLIYVPGEWRCKTCGFHLTKAVFAANTGQVGVDDAEEIEPCPNDDFMMERVTWKDTAIEMGKRLEEIILERFKEGGANARN